jgi:hypothetical protein
MALPYELYCVQWAWGLTGVDGLLVQRNGCERELPSFLLLDLCMYVAASPLAR